MARAVCWRALASADMRWPELACAVVLHGVPPACFGAVRCLWHVLWPSPFPGCPPSCESLAIRCGTTIRLRCRVCCVLAAGMLWLALSCWRALTSADKMFWLELACAVVPSFNPT
eukprot:scaffold89205_cov75-Phaeocystis_antarctica.AAC.1